MASTFTRRSPRRVRAGFSSPSTAPAGRRHTRYSISAIRCADARVGVAGIYNRAAYLPEKKLALERWAAHIERLVTGATARVVSMFDRGVMDARRKAAPAEDVRSKAVI